MLYCVGIAGILYHLGESIMGIQRTSRTVLAIVALFGFQGLRQTACADERPDWWRAKSDVAATINDKISLADLALKVKGTKPSSAQVLRHMTRGANSEEILRSLFAFGGSLLRMTPYGCRPDSTFAFFPSPLPGRSIFNSEGAKDFLHVAPNG